MGLINDSEKKTVKCGKEFTSGVLQRHPKKPSTD